MYWTSKWWCLKTKTVPDFMAIIHVKIPVHTQYIPVHTGMYHFQHYVPVCSRYRPVHTCMYQKPWFRTTGHDSRWYISVWNFQIMYILVYPEYMPVYTCTADFLSWMRGHILLHSLTSEYDVQLQFPACARPACLHPAGLPAPCGRSWIWKQKIRDRNKTHLFKNKYVHYYVCSHRARQ